jgi:HlyD family secretion protein
MEVLVDEIDVRLVEEGQPVSIIVDALPDDELTGRITEIAPTAENIDGVVAYQVTIVPDPTDAPLRAGMSATAVITTTQMDNALTLPNRFIQLDRDTGQAYVYRLENGQPVLTEVRLGLRNERSSQILDGVVEGDEVALIAESQQQQLRGVLFGNP